ncbi:MAG: cell wall hydrolase [Bacteroidales bacterium]|nr:cell wall hydrolase [Bacteroidales bacterium]
MTITSFAYVDISEDDGYRLAKIAMAEAEDQGVVGKALVMRVVLNRVESPEWPDTVEGVLFQKNQFSPCTVDGRYFKVEPDSECWLALDWICDDWDESQGAMYFCTGSKWHETHLTKLFKSGCHTFYK